MNKITMENVKNFWLNEVPFQQDADCCYYIDCRGINCPECYFNFLTLEESQSLSKELWKKYNKKN